MADEKKDPADDQTASFITKMAELNKENDLAFINELTETLSEPKTRIPEPVFREIFLPFFTGEKQASRQEDAFAHWAGIVGSASEPVDVVNVKGEVLFEVPPMYDTSLLRQARDPNDRSNFGSIFQVFAEQSNLHYALGQSHLAKELGPKLKFLTKEGAPGHSWLPVLQHYGLIEKDAPTKKEKTNTDDDLEFLDD